MSNNRSKKRQQGKSQGNRGSYNNSPIVSMSAGDAIGTANQFGRLLTGESGNPELLQEMVYTSGRTAGKTSNVDAFAKTGAKKLQHGKTSIKGHDATICFSDGNGNDTVAIVQCKVLGHRMIGDWRVFTPAQ